MDLQCGCCRCGINAGMLKGPDKHTKKSFVLGKFCSQGSHKLLKSWKTWKIRVKTTCMEKSWNLKKDSNNYGKIMEFSEITVLALTF